MTPSTPDAGPPTAATRAQSSWRRTRRFVKSKLTWNRLFGASSDLKSALWTVPIIAIASRADSVMTRLAWCAVAVLFAKARRESGTKAVS